MARHFLTDAACRTATVPDGAKLAKLNDGEGLFLLVAPVKRHSGRPRKDAPKFTRRWRFAYRFGGRQNTLALGDYPTVTLAVAREKAEDARKLLAAGDDPSARRKAAKHAAANTFDAVADEWLEAQRKRRDLSETTLGKLTWLLSLVRPRLGHLPVAEITPMQCLDALKHLEKRPGRHGRSRHETVGRVRETMRRVFKLAVNTSRANFDPTATLVGGDVLTRPATQHFAAITEPKAFGALLRALGGYDGGPETRLALQLLALTALRPGEQRQLRWSWVSEHGDTPAILLPAEIMKMRRPHVVPLSKQAVAILTELRELTGGSEFVFPSSRSHVRPMSEGTLGAALRRLGYENTEHVPHGFRSSFSTMANEGKLFDPDIIEAALAHDTPGVRGIYNRATYEAERRKLAQWWADRCDELKEERPARSWLCAHDLGQARRRS